jgi:hypothetical protein
MLWRQPVLGDWGAVVDEIAVELCDSAFGAPESAHWPKPVVEAMRRRESALPPEGGTSLPTLHLAESPASAVSWGKWLLMAAFLFELIMLMTRR